MTGAGQGATGTPQPRGDTVAGSTGIDTQATPRTDTESNLAADDATAAGAVDATRFAHASEAEMARILDFYDVRWEYEPSTFPILWNLDGDVIESFAPDFYLPDLEMFLEMTTLKQRLVRKKNRKLRRLRELYPDIRIKLFYARDFRAMMLKYGRLGLAESLSGTPGQVVPERAAVEVPTDEPGIEAAGIPEVPAPPTLPAVLVQETVKRTRGGRSRRQRNGRRPRIRPTDTSPGAEQEAGR